MTRKNKNSRKSNQGLSGLGIVGIIAAIIIVAGAGYYFTKSGSTGGVGINQNATSTNPCAIATTTINGIQATSSPCGGGGSPVASISIFANFHGSCDWNGVSTVTINNSGKTTNLTYQDGKIMWTPKGTTSPIDASITFLSSICPSYLISNIISILNDPAVAPDANTDGRWFTTKVAIATNNVNVKEGTDISGQPIIIIEQRTFSPQTNAVVLSQMAVSPKTWLTQYAITANIPGTNIMSDKTANQLGQTTTYTY
jgi:hypothetical protein